MIEYAIHTHVGERENNEDALKVIHNEDVGYCFIVADGLGGHGRGEDASRYTVEVFEQEFRNLSNSKDYKRDISESNSENSTKSSNEDNENANDDVNYKLENKTSDEAKDNLEHSEDNTVENNTDDITDRENISEEAKNEDNSFSAYNVIENNSKEDNIKDINNFLKNAFEGAAKKLLEEQDKTGALNELKTTGVALTVIDDKIRWAHIGDSRLYMFNNNKIVTRTLDHSVPQMLVFAGEIKEKHIRKHPDRNRLLRVIGARNMDVKVDYSEEYTIDDCQAFLLCSDGFWECITEKKMCKFLRKSKTVSQWLEMMVKEVEKNGKGTNMDNNTAIAVWVKEKRSGILWM